MIKIKLLSRHAVGFFIAPALFIFMLILPPPTGLDPAAWRVAAVGVLMAVLWMSESIPIPVTALLPLILFPIFGITSAKTAAEPYANPLIFLFMGGFILAIAMQQCGLHRRIALSIIAGIGLQPRSIIAGFMIATATISMWVSNTATALMMLPIAMSVVELRAKDEQNSKNFATALFLCITYSASIGGFGTLIGTPPNALLAGFLQETYGFQIGFAQWMLFGVPIILVGLPITFIVLTVVLFPMKSIKQNDDMDIFRRQLFELGRMTKAEKRVALIFLLVALAWMTQPLLAKVSAGLSDTVIALIGALFVFVLPSGEKPGEFLLDWKTAEKLPWGVLLLFGGGLSLASAISETGLSVWIGEKLALFQAAPAWVLVLVLTTVIVFLTELTSNTAIAATFLPIMASLATSVAQNPLLFVVPAGIGASCAFMLPVATPPNAIVYASGKIDIMHMVKAGFLLNIAFIVIITVFAFLLLPPIFDVRLGIVPAWAQ